MSVSYMDCELPEERHHVFCHGSPGAQHIAGSCQGVGDQNGRTEMVEEVELAKEEEKEETRSDPGEGRASRNLESGGPGSRGC